MNPELPYWGSLPSQSMGLSSWIDTGRRAEHCERARDTPQYPERSTRRFLWFVRLSVVFGAEWLSGDEDGSVVESECACGVGGLPGAEGDRFWLLMSLA